MIKPAIQITIVDDSRSEPCPAECGLDWASAEVRALASQQIKNRFGDKIELEYLDLAKATANRQPPELNQQVKGENLLFPLLVINGQLRIAGDFDIRQLLDAIEAEIEIGV